MSSSSLHTVVDSPSNSHQAIMDVEKQVPASPTAPSSPPSPAFLFRTAMKKMTINGILLTVVFWAMACWLYGSYFDTPNHVHQLHVLVVDFDGGAVGSALLAAVKSVNGQPAFPTFDVVSANTTSVEAVNKHVFQGHVWGAIYTQANSSTNYEAAMASDSVAASYNPNEALVYTGLEARYYTIWSADVLAPLKALVAITGEVFAKQTIVPYVTTLTETLGVNQATVMSAPIGSSFLNQAPFPQGERGVINTIGFVYPVLLQFFFLIAFNGIFTATGVYHRSNLAQHLAFRVPISIIWSLLGGISVIGWALTFKEGLHVDARNVFGLFAIAWAYSMTMFDLLDGITSFVPMPFVPFVTIFLVITSVAATSQPIDIANAFYRIHYAMPSHPAWELMIMCYGKGATVDAKLHIALPILLVWVVVAKAFALLGIRHRVNTREVDTMENAHHPSQ